MIDRFRDKYFFLSNFWICEIMFDGDTYPSVEHAYQAAKSRNQHYRKTVRRALTCSRAKMLGSGVALREDWTDEKRIEVMKRLLRQKFYCHELLRVALVETGDEELVEGNDHGDRFWGKVDGAGENHLGRLLMEIRGELREG